MNKQELVMRNKVYDDIRICGACEGRFVLHTESEDHVEGQPNPVIHDETYEGLFCFECIEREEKRIEEDGFIFTEYLDRYVDEDGNIEKKLTLTSDGFALLTEDIEALVDKYTGIENIGFMECAEIRLDLMDLIHDIANNHKESDSD